MSKTIAKPVFEFTVIELPEHKITAPAKYRAQAKKLMPFIKGAEGGLSRATTDRASAHFCPTPNPEDGLKYHTNKGITYTTWEQWMGGDRDLEFYEMSDENWLYIFKKGYWNVCKADNIYSQEVANTLVDWVWTSWIVGIKHTQRMLGVIADGIVGVNTLKAINRQNKDRLIKRMYNRREQFFKDIAKNDPTQKINLNGWLNRLENLKTFNDKWWKYR